MGMPKWMIVWGALSALVPITGCGGDDGPPRDDDEPGEENPLAHEKTDWTIFVYGHADHNLGPSLVADIREMAAARLDGKVNVVVMADWNGGQEPFESGTEFYRVAGGGQDPELLATAPELNLDDPEVMAEAIALVLEANPADHYGLIIWDHGGAWKLGFGSDLQDGTLERPRGMGVHEAAGAIRAGLDAAGLDGDRALDFLSFDTCLMAGAEVISEMAPLARIYIANAEIDYGAGWDYTAALSWIAAHPDASPAELARAEVAAWDAHHRAQGATDLLLRSHVAIDTTRWDTFMDAYASFATTFTEGEGGVSVGRSLSRSLPGFELSSVADLGDAPSLRDVGQFLTFFEGGADAALADRAAIARAALEATLLARSSGTLREAQAGVHLELPPASEIGDDMMAAYRALAPVWAEGAAWGDGLERLAGLDDTVGPELVTELENGQGPSREELPKLRFGSESLDVDSADIQLGFVPAGNPDAVVILGLLATGTVEPASMNSYVWDGGSWTLPGAAGSEQYVTVGPWARLGAGGDGEAVPPILQVIGILEDGAGNLAQGALLIDGGNGSVPLVVVYTSSGNPAMFTLRDLAGVGFTPMVPVLGLSTGEVTYVAGETFALPGEGLGLGRAQLPAGTAALITVMTDVWGNQETGLDLVQLSQPIPE